MLLIENISRTRLRNRVAMRSAIPPPPSKAAGSNQITEKVNYLALIWQTTNWGPGRLWKSHHTRGGKKNWKNLENKIATLEKWAENVECSSLPLIKLLLNSKLLQRRNLRVYRSELDIVFTETRTANIYF